MKALLWIPPGTQPMAQVLDRPLVQHVVEQIVERGVRSITLLHGAGDAATVAYLGSGERWGIAITPHAVTGPPANIDFAAGCGAEDEWMLLGNAARVSHLPSLGADSAAWNTLFFDEEDGVGAWSGWAVLQAESLPGFAAPVAAGADWRAAVRESGLAIKKVFLDHPSLSAASARDVLVANRRALNGEFPGLFFNGKERSPGVWVARAAKVAASARLQAPCYVGEDAWIGADCRIGPYSVIAAGCVVERETTVARSVVYEGTFLGPELEVSDSCVNYNRIHNVRLGAEIEVGETHVASALSPAAGGRFLGFLRAGR